MDKELQATLNDRRISAISEVASRLANVQREYELKIIAAVDAGVSQRVIAAAAGISHTQVQRIVKAAGL
jgi:hypothetical protein